MKIWSNKEVEFLKNNYVSMSYNLISKKLNRTIKSIYWKAFELNLKKGRWNDKNRLSKEKIIKFLQEEKNKLGKSPSVREIPITLKSACQRHFGNFNAAKKAAGLDVKEHIKKLPKDAYRPSKELAYITGLLLGDGSFRYQKSKGRTSYVIIFATKDKDLMDIFTKKFKKWSNFEPRLVVLKGGFKRFPSGQMSHYQKTYYTQIAFKEAWYLLKKFKNNPLACLEFFPKKHYKWIIKGLWDAEGCIRIKNEYIRIYFSNSDENILSLYKSLLKKYDLNYCVEKQKHNSVNITISDKFNVLKFIKTIEGITIKRKETPEIKKIINELEFEYKKADLNSSFKKQVYGLLKQVPTGYVTTYAKIAEKLNTKAYRAVGNVLNKNPYAPKIQCHRVVCSNASIGGYSRGIKKKIALLKKEGIEIKNNKIIDFKKRLFKIQ